MQSRRPWAAVLVWLLALLALSILGGPRVAATEPGDVPEPSPGVRVVDPDDRLAPGDEARLQAIAERIERDTGAQVVFVVTVSHGWRPTESAANLQARQLMDRWGVGRAGIDDGVVALAMLDDTGCHGAAYLFLGRGALKAWFLGSSARVKALYDRSVGPRLQACDVAGALRAAGEGLERAAAASVARHRTQAAATPSADTDLRPAAALALVLAAGVAAVTAAWWWIAGRDPRLADDDSIHLGGPPPGLTPALAATLLARGPSDLALAATLVDAAGRGEVAFLRVADQGPGGPGLGFTRPDPVPEPGPPPGRPDTASVPGLAPRIPSSPTRAEAEWSQQLGAAMDRHGGRLERADIRELVPARRELGIGLEAELVSQGLLGRTRRGLRVLAIPVVLIALLASTVAWLAQDPIVAGAMLVAAMLAGGPLLCLAVVGAPVLTRDGVRTRAWLDAFRRTLARSLRLGSNLDDAAWQARAMGHEWLDRPDRLLAWAVALGLADQATEVLRRTGDRTRLPPWVAGMDDLATLTLLGRMGKDIATFDQGRGISLGGFAGGVSAGGGGGDGDV